MPQQTDPIAQDDDRGALSSAEWVRRRFAAAWDDAMLGRSPPDVDEFLITVPEAERSQVRQELVAVDEEYRRRNLGPTDTAIPIGKHLPQRPDAPTGTVDFMPKAGVAALKQGGGINGMAPAAAVPLGTVEFTPGAGQADPNATLAPEAGQSTAATDGKAGDSRPTAKPADPRATVAPEAGKQVVAGAPETVAGYEILGVLGRGAMGVVYKARQRGLSRVVALKMILSGGHASEHELSRFRTEAEAVARIQHPNIVQIYEVGEENGLPFFSLEYVDGGSLASTINHVPQKPKEAARLANVLAGAMDAAHRAGVIHRDLKPANVLMTVDGVPKITDFGLAKRLEEADSSHTHSGSILGSPGYMSPEQAEGRNVDVGPLSDVYALGVVLYEMLTGRIPFRAPTIMETLQQIRTIEPVPPVQLQPTVPRDLDTICLKCLQKDPKKRYETAGALAEDLRRFLNQEPILARPVGGLERAWRWCRRNPRLAVMGAAVALVVLGWGVSMSVLAVMLKAEKDSSDRNFTLAMTKKKEAEDNYTLAMTKKKEAEDNAADAKAKKELADHNAAEAKANEKKANDGAAVAVRRMSAMAGLVQKKLNGRFFSPISGPEVGALRDDVLAQLRAGMQGMAQELDKAGATSFGEIATYQEMGDRLKHLGQGEDALKQFRLGSKLGEQIVEAQPDNDRARANEGVMLIRLGEMELELNGDARAALDYYEKGRAMRQEVVDHPRSHDYTGLDDKIQLSHYEIGLGKTELALGDAAAARDHFEKAVSLRKAWSEALPKLDEGRSYLAEAYLWRGTACSYLGDADGSRTSFDEAMRISQGLVDKFPKAFWYKADLADVLGRRGDAEMRLGKKADAAKDYHDSLEDLRPALDQKPDETDYQLQLARAEERLGLVGEGEAARKAYQEALRVRNDFLAIEPSNLTWQAARNVTLAHCGKEADAAQKADDLCKKRPKCVPLLLEAARCYAACASAAAEAEAEQRYAGQAVGALRAAATEGYKDTSALKTDLELAPLQDDASFRSLMEELAKK